MTQLQREQRSCSTLTAGVMPGQRTVGFALAVIDVTLGGQNVVLSVSSHKDKGVS